MTPEQFINHWKDNPLTERAGAQQHFDDLCDLLGVDKPRDSENYCFERGAKKDGGGEGWADVWKRDCFGWENKKPGRDLNKALAQLREYSGNLGNPPLLVVCDRERIEIHTAFRGYPDEPRTILLKDIGDPVNLQTLKWIFTDPDKLKPIKSNAAITREAAEEFAKLARAMRERGIDPQQAAHFLTQCIFCMFAEDEGLLHDSPTENAEIFSHLLKAARSSPDKAADRIKKLFTAMQKKGGNYGDDDIAWFNGGLFKTIEIPSLTESDLNVLYHAANSIDWRAIDPTIFGTLFERGLDPNCRAQLGAHYTDVATIQKLIDPLIARPLAAEWEAAKAKIIPLIAKSGKTTKSKNFKAAANLYHAYLERLRNFRVLDAACGSGNFLYLALHALKDLEHKAQIDAETLGLPKQIDVQAGTDNILGIETNEYAAELARVTVWIGDIQWCQRNGRPINKNPILRSLDGIQHRDALLNADGSEAAWPPADVILGNPPFLGQRFQLKELGETYIKSLRGCYAGRLSGNADLVCYWFEKARIQIEQGKTVAAGLVSTNSIRGGANKEVLDAIVQTVPIFEAWADEDWFDNGTAVRVSLVCFGKNELNTTQLDGETVSVIHTDLTAGNADKSMDLSAAIPLIENLDTAFSGFQMNGPFDVSGDIARQWLTLPNPNNLPNSMVLRPYSNAKDITARDRGQYVIDFTGLDKDDACLFEVPFDWVEKHVKPARMAKREEKLQKNYWLHKRSSPAMRKAIDGLKRFIATPMVSKHRLFVWLPEIKTPENAAIVIARPNDTTFGILHSRFHELWALAVCTWMGVGNDPRYTPSTCFDTFPFPDGLTPADTAPKSEAERLALGYPTEESFENAEAFTAPVPAIIANKAQRPHAQAIADAAFKLNQLRENWLNPQEWVDWVITPEEEKAGFPKRPVAKAGHEADLKKRTLTNLYNAKPAWLVNAHQALDNAVAKAYGWNDYTPEMSDSEILQRLLKLNLQRANDSETDTLPE